MGLTNPGTVFRKGSVPTTGHVATFAGPTAIQDGGVVATVVAGVPINETDTGTPYQIAFDGSGNLYFCYGTNTWAKFTNVAPFGNHFRGTQAGDARITQDGSSRITQ